MTNKMHEADAGSSVLIRYDVITDHRGVLFMSQLLSTSSRLVLLTFAAPNHCHSILARSEYSILTSEYR